MDPLTSQDDAANASATWPERAALALAMIGICALCLTVTITVVSRAIYRPLIPDDVLIVRELMVATILFPMAFVTAARAHISVTIFTEWAPPRVKAGLSLTAHLFGLMFAGWLFFAGWRLLAGAWTSGEYYDGDIYVPMWIGYGSFVLAVLVFACRLAVMAGADARNLWHAD